MGYYNDFKLKVNTDDDVILEQVADDLDEISTYDWEECDVGEFSLDGAKWYHHEEDMKKVSALYPDLLFTVSAVGEENGDLWKAHFKNGKMQHCPAIITYEEYDESKLK